jgi:hypothetical protein
MLCYDLPGPKISKPRKNQAQTKENQANNPWITLGFIRSNSAFSIGYRDSRDKKSAARFSLRRRKPSRRRERSGAGFKLSRILVFGKKMSEKI